LSLDDGGRDRKKRLVNESLCKLIYVNLRLTVEREISTGYQMNYFRDTFFPAIPAKDKLIG